jgi:hypothetical protein
MRTIVALLLTMSFVLSSTKSLGDSVVLPAYLKPQPTPVPTEKVDSGQVFNYVVNREEAERIDTCFQDRDQCQIALAKAQSTETKDNSMAFVLGIGGVVLGYFIGAYVAGR